MDKNLIFKHKARLEHSSLYMHRLGNEKNPHKLNLMRGYLFL